MQNHVVTVKGRTKLARETGIGRVNLDLNALEQLFNYRQEDAAAMLVHSILEVDCSISHNLSLGHFNDKLEDCMSSPGC